MATITVTGKVTTDVVLERLPAGSPVVNLHIAERPVDRPVKGRVRPGHTNFYKVSAVGKLAVWLMEHVQAGDVITVTGEEYGFTRECRCCPPETTHGVYRWEVWLDRVDAVHSPAPDRDGVDGDDRAHDDGSACRVR